MGRTYAALEAATTYYRMPEDTPIPWPTNPDGSPLWDFPYDDPDYDGPWPPGWPYNNTAIGGEILVTGPGETYVDGANLSVEFRIVVTDDQINTSGYDGQILFVNAAVLDGDGESTAIQLKNSTDSEYADYLNYTVDNYSGAKHGANPTLNFDCGAYTGQTLYIYAVILAMDDTVEGTNEDATVDGDYISVDAPDSVYSDYAVSITCDCLDADDSDVSTYNGESIAISATIGGETIQVKKLAGDTYADSIEFSITNYTGDKYGFSSNVFFDADDEIGETITVNAEIVDQEHIDGSDDGTVVAAPIQYTLYITDGPDQGDWVANQYLNLGADNVAGGLTSISGLYATSTYNHLTDATSTSSFGQATNGQYKLYNGDEVIQSYVGTADTYINLGAIGPVGAGGSVYTGLITFYAAEADIANLTHVGINVTYWYYDAPAQDFTGRMYLYKGAPCTQPAVNLIQVAHNDAITLTYNSLGWKKLSITLD